MFTIRMVVPTSATLEDIRNIRKNLEAQHGRKSHVKMLRDFLGNSWREVWLDGDSENA